MGSSKSPSTPKPKVDLEELEARRAQWIEEATLERDEAIQASTARMAASGLRKDSALWKTNLQKVEDDYQARLTEIESSATVTLLNSERERRAKKDRIRNTLRASGELMTSARSELSYLSEGIGARPSKVATRRGLVSSASVPLRNAGEIRERRQYLNQILGTGRRVVSGNR